jgi:hypothetical protein
MNRLSSRATSFWKNIFPIIIFFASVLFAANMLANDAPFYIVLLLGFLVIIYSFVSVRKARQVHYDNEYLYIEYQTKSIKIPLTRILEINEFWITPRTATIVLKEPCEIGHKVKYIQRFKPFLFAANHPDVIKLYERLKTNARKELEAAKKEKERIYRLFAD